MKRNFLVVMILLAIAVAQVSSNFNGDPLTFWQFQFNPKFKEHLIRLTHGAVIEQMKKDAMKEEQRKKAEKENEIYRKFLANRVTASSILNDFLTMRY